MHRFARTCLLRPARCLLNSGVLQSQRQARLQPPATNKSLTLRRFGVLDWGREKLQQRADNKRDALFNEQMEALLKHPKLTLKVYKDTMKSAQQQQESSWASKIPGAKNSDEWKELMAQVSFLDELTAPMLRNPRLINGTVKKKIAEHIGRPVEKINEWLRSIDQLQAMHQWMRAQRAKGIELPKTQQEIIAKMMADPRGISPKKMMRKQRRR